MQPVQFGASRSSSPTPSEKIRRQTAEILKSSIEAQAKNDAQYSSSLTAQKKDTRTSVQQRRDAVEVENRPGIITKIISKFKPKR